MNVVDLEQLTRGTKMPSCILAAVFPVLVSVCYPSRYHCEKHRTFFQLRPNNMAHHTIKDMYGPGTFTDVTYTPLPAECQRLLRYFGELSPGFTKDASAVANVDFHGADQPVIPGPLKSQAFVSV